MGPQCKGLGSNREGSASPCRRGETILNRLSGTNNQGQGKVGRVILAKAGEDESETWELSARGARNRQVLGERRELEAELARQNYFLEGIEGVKFEFRV